MVVPSLMRLWFRLGSLSNRDQRTLGVSPAAGGVGAVNRLGKRLFSCTRLWATMSLHHVITLPASALFFTSHSGGRLEGGEVAPSALPQLSPAPQVSRATRAQGRLGSRVDDRVACAFARLGRSEVVQGEGVGASRVIFVVRSDHHPKADAAGEGLALCPITWHPLSNAQCGGSDACRSRHAGTVRRERPVPNRRSCRCVRPSQCVWCGAPRCVPARPVSAPPLRRAGASHQPWSNQGAPPPRAAG
jgi:hypothetical protein